MTPPKHLTDRDPRNVHHQLAAFSIMQNINGSIPDVAAFYFSDQGGLILPDNVLQKCCGCQQLIQVRPELKTTPMLCCFCMVERMLTHYWMEKHELKAAH